MSLQSLFFIPVGKQLLHGLHSHSGVQYGSYDLPLFPPPPPWPPLGAGLVCPIPNPENPVVSKLKNLFVVSFVA